MATGCGNSTARQQKKTEIKHSRYCMAKHVFSFSAEFSWTLKLDKWWQSCTTVTSNTTKATSTMPQNQTGEDKEGANSRAANCLLNSSKQCSVKKKIKKISLTTYNLFPFSSLGPLITFSKSITESKSILAGFPEAEFSIHTRPFSVNVTSLKLWHPHTLFAE